MFLPKLIPIVFFVAGTWARYIGVHCSAGFDQDGNSLGQGPCDLPDKGWSNDIVMNIKRNPQGSGNPNPPTTPAANPATTPPANPPPATTPPPAPPPTTPANNPSPNMATTTPPSDGGSTTPPQGGSSSETFAPAITIAGTLGKDTPTAGDANPGNTLGATGNPGIPVASNNQGAPTPTQGPVVTTPANNNNPPPTTPVNNNPTPSTPVNNNPTPTPVNNNPTPSTPANNNPTTSTDVNGQGTTTKTPSPFLPSTAVIITTTDSQGNTITTASFQGGATTRLPAPTNAGNTGGGMSLIGRIVDAGFFGSVASFATFVVMVLL